MGTIANGRTWLSGEPVTPAKLSVPPTLTPGTILPADLTSNILSAQAATLTTPYLYTGAAGTNGPIPGLSLNVTLPFATSTVLLLGSISGSGLYTGLILMRNGSALITGNAAGSRTPVTWSFGYEQGNIDTLKTIPINFLDAPGAAGVYTYSLNVANTFGGYQAIINAGANDSNNAAYDLRAISQLIALVIP